MASPRFSFTNAVAIADAILGVNLITGTIQQDVVGIYDQETFQQLFQPARPMKALIRREARVMNHPVETGAVLSDHKIILPVEVEIPVFISTIDFDSTYQQIQNAFINATLLTVQTRSGVLQSMIIQSLPTEESPDRYDMLVVYLRLKEVQFVAPSSIASQNAPAGYATAVPQYQRQVPRGLQMQQPIALTSSILSYIRTLSAWGR